MQPVYKENKNRLFFINRNKKQDSAKGPGLMPVKKGIEIKAGIITT
jgi:hypothetical protein